MPLSKRIRFSLLCAAAVFLGAMFWYQWSSTPLSQSEIDSYMARIAAQTQDPGGRHDMAALRAFLETDDGRPVYTVNLYAYHKVAAYPPSAPFAESGREAFDRFSRVMLGLMATRAAHPIFGSNRVDRFSSERDRIVIVRYRSRRDLVDLFATDEFADASLHKWASLRLHDRLIVGALHISNAVWPLILLAVAIATAGPAVLRRSNTAR